MKIVSFILSLIIFSQSLSVCGPSFSYSQKLSDFKECTSDVSKSDSHKSHSCCSKEEKTNQNKEEKKDCCGDDCKCFCCIKIIGNDLHYYKTEETDSKLITENSIGLLMVHSFDFHPSISYPPQT